MRFFPSSAIAGLIYCIAAFSGHAAAASGTGADHSGDSTAPAQKVRLDTPSGFPVPRYVSLKSSRVNCRIGPSKAHPIKFTYVKKGAPMVVIAETKDHWRKIRDRAGAACWAHKSLLTGVTHAYATRDFEMTARPRSDGRVRAMISDGALVRLEQKAGSKKQREWVRVSAGPIAGWAPRDALWGAGDAAAHN